MLPHLEHMHWNQVAADYEDLAIKDAFEEIALGFMEDALKQDRLKTIRGDDSVKGGAGEANA